MYKIIPPHRLENGAADRLEAAIDGAVHRSGQVSDLKKKAALGDNELHRIMDVIYSSVTARELVLGQSFQVQLPPWAKTRVFISWLGVNL